MTARDEIPESQREGAFLQALGAQFGILQGSRGATISESSARSSLYMTTLSGAVVSLALVAQATRFGQTFFIFALAIVPVVFFLGVVTYYRVLQTGVEDVIYARAMSKILDFYSQIEPAHAGFFHASAVDQVGLRDLGMWSERWQPFLSASATIAIVNSVVGGVLVGLTVAHLASPPALASVGTGAAATLFFAAAFLIHQARIRVRAAAALPMAEQAAHKKSS